MSRQGFVFGKILERRSGAAGLLGRDDRRQTRYPAEGVPLTSRSGEDSITDEGGRMLKLFLVMALMFLPSESIYAELHSNFTDVVEVSYRSKVWIVSPTTLMATLNTVRAVLKDARMREMAGVIQKEVGSLTEDISRLDDRIESLSKHFDMASRDIGDIKVSSGKISRRIDRIEDIQLGNDKTPVGVEHLAS